MTESDEGRPQSIWRRMAQNVGWLLGARAFNLPLALLESVLLARFLGPESYGILAVVMASVIVVQRIFSFRMNEFVVKYLTEALEEEKLARAAATLKVAFLAEGLSALLACAVTMACAPLLVEYFLTPDQPAAYFRLFALWAITNSVTESCTGALLVFDRFKFLATINVTRKIILVALITGLFFSSGGVAEILVAYLAANLIANSVLVRGVQRAIEERLGAGWWRVSLSKLESVWLEMRRFAVMTHLGATLSVIVRDGDLLWIGFFRPSAEVGYYKLATSLLKAPFAAGSPMIKAFSPEVTRMVAGGVQSGIGAFLRRTTAYSAAWVVPVSIATAAIAPFVIRNFHGEAFLPALPALWILLSGTAVAYMLFWTRPTLLAFGRPDTLLKLTILSAALKVVFGVLVVPAFGYIGLATLFTSIQILGFALLVWAVYRGLPRGPAEPSLG